MLVQGFKSEQSKEPTTPVISDPVPVIFSNVILSKWTALSPGGHGYGDCEGGQYLPVTRIGNPTFSTTMLRYVISPT